MQKQESFVIGKYDFDPLGNRLDRRHTIIFRERFLKSGRIGVV